MSPIRVLIVDDSVTIRAMIEALFERDRDIRIVGIAGSATEAFAMIDLYDPHVVTLDIAMPGMDGMEMLDEIMAREPRPVLMLSSMVREGAPVVEQAMARGALGCFNKSRIVQESKKLITLIKQVAPKRQVMREKFLQRQESLRRA